MDYKKTNRKSGFRAPEGYFDTLEDRIMQAVSLNRKLPEKDGFSLPDGYLEQMEDRVLSTVGGKSGDKGFSRPRRKTPVYTLRDIGYAIATAAAAIVILSTVFQVDFFPARSEKAYSITNIPQEDIEFYINNNMLPLYTEDVTELLNTADLDTISFSSLNDDDVISYLEENLTDYSDINLNE